MPAYLVNPINTNTGRDAYLLRHLMARVFSFLIIFTRFLFSDRRQNKLTNDLFPLVLLLLYLESLTAGRSVL